MRTFPFLQVDAFTTEPLAGNACAVVFDEDARLDDATMQAVAREMNLSETSFVRRPTPGSGADFAARYFTPGAEIPLAGHPTVATLFALVETGRLRLVERSTRTRLELKAGVIRVDVEAGDERGTGGVREVAMWQPAPQFLRTFPAAEALAAFGLRETDGLPLAAGGIPAAQVVSTGTPQLMVPVRDREALRRARMDVGRLEQLRQGGDFREVEDAASRAKFALGDAITGTAPVALELRARERPSFFSAHLFCLEGATPAGQTFARHFAPGPNEFEDPFTGSATGGMGAFLWRYGLIETPTFTAEQGHWMGRPGQASVGVIGPREAIANVRVAGPAVTVLRGELVLP